MGNDFYAAAVQAGTKSWKAFLFGSFDSSNFITVDKPPASLWVMELSARVFGVNAWGILLPQALEGVAAVWLLFATVRRRFGAGAGLLAVAGVALVVSAGWWVALVELWPAASRPYVGGSQDNSLLNLIFGYNGFGRVTGAESGSVIGGGQGRAGAWGPTGLTRLFGAEM